MASRHTQTYTLMGLGIVLAASIYYNTRSADTGSAVPVDNFTFQPLDVQEPRLHIDRLSKLLKLEYSGPHRNIFVAAALPPTQVAGQKALKPRESFVGPKPPPPPPRCRFRRNFLATLRARPPADGSRFSRAAMTF